MYLKTKALVIHVTEYYNENVLLLLLTPDHGRISAKVKGIRRKNSTLSASCQLLAYSEFTLFEYRDMYTVNEASTIELFMPLRNDLLKLSLGTYFAQIGGTVALEDTPSSEILSLTLNCLYALSHLNVPDTQVKAVFELRMVSIAGYTPNLECCVLCGSETPLYFDFAGGVLLCEQCGGYLQTPYQDIDPSILEALRYILNCDPKKLFSFRVGDATLENLAALTETYLLTQFELCFPTLDFYKSLLN